MGQMPGKYVAQVAYQAGFRGDDLAKIVAIGYRESHWDPTAWRSQNRPNNTGDFGLFQINYGNDTDAAQKTVGYTNRNPEWLNPVTNARMAFYLYNRSNQTFAPWKAASGGFNPSGDPFYNVDLSKGYQAVKEAEADGLLGKPFDKVPLDPATGKPFVNTSPADDVKNYVGNALGINSVVDFLRLLSDGHTWVRVGKVLAGAGLIGLGLYVFNASTVNRAVMGIASGGASEVVRGATDATTTT